ncbi:NifQ family protein [Cereibacter sphaeroides WS8N]|uniref:nitrogen fixation protein NifQ n=1 Tax=Cereibacter sphaeroides TaxID=1063 RepID=UPI00020DF935|nr:nitrogen fixation protein NifQ [Cereibacter sphaeroides]EGJ22004.1 NifQ family protein [Cereibacter sphaeroides WS8N]
MNQWSADLFTGAAADRADMAAILAHALREQAAGRGELCDLLGLEPAALEALVARWCPGLTLPALAPPGPLPIEQSDLATLLLWRGGRTSDEARWLAAILARRALEANHLWEDLGLPSRAHLGRLIERHFPRLHAANTRNMRWKRFFYRQICTDHGGTMCLAPNCDACAEQPLCFGPDAD